MKAFEKVGNQDVIEDLQYQEAMLQETLCYESLYCKRCAFHDVGDQSVGINEHCEHDRWVNEEGEITDKLNDEMITR